MESFGNKISDDGNYNVVPQLRVFFLSLLWSLVMFLPAIGIDLVFRENYYGFHFNLISGGWNREVPLYTEVSSFQGVGIERFHCIQKCPHFRGLV